MNSRLTHPLPTPTEEDMVELALFSSWRRVQILVQREVLRRTIAVVTAAGYIITLDKGEDAASERNVEALPISIMEALSGFDRGTLYLYRSTDDVAPASITMVMNAAGWHVLLDDAPTLVSALQPVVDFAAAMAEWV